MPFQISKRVAVKTVQNSCQENGYHEDIQTSEKLMDHAN